MEIGIISIVIAVIIALIPYARYRYFLGPELTIEIIPDGGMSSPRGLNSKNKVNAEVYIDGNKAIRIFELTWRLKLVNRNNSYNTSYYLKILFISSKPKFTIIDSINELKPLTNTENIELKAIFKT